MQMRRLQMLRLRMFRLSKIKLKTEIHSDFGMNVYKYVFHIILAETNEALHKLELISKILFTLKESQRLSSVLPSIANLTFVNLHGSNLYTRLLKLG